MTNVARIAPRFPRHFAQMGLLAAECEYLIGPWRGGGGRALGWAPDLPERRPNSGPCGVLTRDRPQPMVPPPR